MERTVLAAIAERPDADTALAEQVRRVRAAMDDLDVQLRWTHRTQDALAVIGSDASLAGMLADWDAPGAEQVLRAVTQRFRGLPVFLMTTEQELPLWVYEVIQGYVFPLEDTPDFIAGRIAHAAERTPRRILPPFFRALRRFEDHHEYSWHTPAHAGGVAFLKSPVGRAFFDFYGERLLRTDLSISVGELGSPLRAHRPDRRGRAQRRPGLRRRPHLLRAARRLHLPTAWSATTRRPRRDRPGGPQLPQVGPARRWSSAAPAPSTWSRPATARPGRPACHPPRSRPTPCATACRGHPLARTPCPGQYAVITNSTYDGLCYDAVRRRRAARSEQRPPAALRRGVVRLRPLPPALRRPLRHGRGRADPAGAATGPPCSPPSPRTSCWPRCRSRAMVHVRPAPSARRWTRPVQRGAT